MDSALQSPHFSAYDTLEDLSLYHKKIRKKVGIKGDQLEKLGVIIGRRFASIPTQRGFKIKRLTLWLGEIDDKGFEPLIRGHIVAKDSLVSLSLRGQDLPNSGLFQSNLTMKSYVWLTQAQFPNLESLSFYKLAGLEAPPRVWLEKQGIEGKKLPKLAPSTLKHYRMNLCIGLPKEKEELGLAGIDKAYPALELLDLNLNDFLVNLSGEPSISYNFPLSDAFCRELKLKLPNCEIIGARGTKIETQFMRVAFKGDQLGKGENKRPDFLALVRKSDQMVMPLDEWENKKGPSSFDVSLRLLLWTKPTGELGQPTPRFKTFTDSGFLEAGDYTLIARLKDGRTYADTPVKIVDGLRTEVIFDWAKVQKPKPVAEDAEHLVVHVLIATGVSEKLQMDKMHHDIAFFMKQESQLAMGNGEITARVHDPSNAQSAITARQFSRVLASEKSHLEAYLAGVPLFTLKFDPKKVKAIKCIWDGKEWSHELTQR